MTLDTTTNSSQPLKRSLQVFLCYASDDKPAVRSLYQQLKAERGIVPWFDEEALLPGQKWKHEIPKAVRNSDIVLVCLSQKSVNKSGYVQKEIRFALDVADNKPEDTIYIIPVRLEECEAPERLRNLQWENFFAENGYERLMQTLRKLADELS